MTPMMRARHQEGSFIRGSTFQYRAPTLLYSDTGPWHGLDMATASARIRRTLPAELRRAWALLQGGATRGEEEREAERAAEWIGRYGEQHGFRPPNLAERSRVTGCAEYLESLGLDARALFDANGNHFDRCVVALRIGHPVMQWLQGGSAPERSLCAGH